MARIRTYKPESFSDSKTGMLSSDAFKLFFGLISYADDYGVVAYDLVEFKGRIFPYQPLEFEKVIESSIQDEIVKRDLAQIFEVSGRKYIHIRNFTKHQKVDKPGKPLLTQWDKYVSVERYQAFIRVDSANGSESSQIPAVEGKGKEGKGKDWSREDSREESEGVSPAVRARGGNSSGFAPGMNATELAVLIPGMVGFVPKPQTVDIIRGAIELEGQKHVGDIRMAAERIFEAAKKYSESPVFRSQFRVQWVNWFADAKYNEDPATWQRTDGQQPMPTVPKMRDVSEVLRERELEKERTGNA